MFFVFFNDKGNMEQTNQTGPSGAKSAYFTVVQHLITTAPLMSDLFTLNTEILDFFSDTCRLWQVDYVIRNWECFFPRNLEVIWRYTTQDSPWKQCVDSYRSNLSQLSEVCGGVFICLCFLIFCAQDVYSHLPLSGQVRSGLYECSDQVPDCKQ